MATRCPSSYFIGRAVLPDYAWQINQRGVANVVPCAGRSVHGLVYELGGADDERRLDRSEGVRTGAYAKATLPVVLYEAAPALQLRVPTMVQNGGAGATVAAARRRTAILGVERPSRLAEQPPRLQPGVLVYLSEAYVQPGDPRDEYIDRINKGVADGVTLGVPAEFFRNAVRGYIPDRAPPVPRRSGSRSGRSNVSTTTTTTRSRRGSQSSGRPRASSVSSGPIIRDADPDDIDYRRRSWNPSPVEYQRYTTESRGRTAGSEDYEYWAPASGYVMRSRSTRRG
ncbi:uncharacterized protein B0H64DRAFT_396784 [Chaetomium fimeti]|uniref:gamma-glutamylcyclotransferase n=1 Tax=Chaetomium fimeti TaxID=1854472 RepID=A0AAE0HGJ4_9PEZI|nr:hypothetical protein B0H64DRAFT_396784 [Chaetomium fimeti]